MPVSCTTVTGQSGSARLAQTPERSPRGSPLPLQPRGAETLLGTFFVPHPIPFSDEDGGGTCCIHAVHPDFSGELSEGTGGRGAHGPPAHGRAAASHACPRPYEQCGDGAGGTERKPFRGLF
ncbi:uncharacterized protein PRD47_006138 isoform 5-T5 [Ara ararauna]